MKMNRFLVASLTAVAGLSMSATALAAEGDTTLAGGTFQAKITITKNCLMSIAATDMVFPDTSSNAGSAVSANTGFSVICTSATPYKIGLQSTATDAPITGAGAMAGTGGSIAYQLYQDAGTTIAWGNDPATAATLKAATGTGDAQAYTVYGKTTGSLNVPAGDYSDVVSVSVYY